ncbi:hypothetical protein ACKS0A_01850 [Histoplasma ohiense]
MHHGGSSSNIVLQMEHEMRAVSFHLLVGRDRAKDDFGKLAVSEFSECDPADDLQRHFDDSHRQVSAIVDETRDIVLGHFRQLLLKQALEACKDNGTLSGAIIVDHSELDLSIPLFQNCRL